MLKVLTPLTMTLLDEYVSPYCSQQPFLTFAVPDPKPICENAGYPAYLTLTHDLVVE
jgi:hypothetical protein